MSYINTCILFDWESVTSRSYTCRADLCFDLFVEILWKTLLTREEFLFYFCGRDKHTQVFYKCVYISYFAFKKWILNIPYTPTYILKSCSFPFWYENPHEHTCIVSEANYYRITILNFRAKHSKIHLPLRSTNNTLIDQV